MNLWRQNAMKMAAIFLTFLLGTVCGQKLRTLCAQTDKCRKMRTLSNKCPKIQIFPKFCHGRVQKCEPFGAFWQGRTQKCEPFCESSPKVRTVLKFWRACAQKCEPFGGFGVGCAQKCQLFGNFGKRVSKSANPCKFMAQDVPRSANFVHFFVKKCEPFWKFVWMCGAASKPRTLSAELAPKVLHPTIDQKNVFLWWIYEGKMQ